MTTFNYSLESRVNVSAQFTSTASSSEDAIIEARLAQTRGAINWDRSGTKIGPIFENYKTWATKNTDGSWSVSLVSSIIITSTGTAEADSSEILKNSLRNIQISGGLNWLYRGTPVGIYRASSISIWTNEA